MLLLLMGAVTKTSIFLFFRADTAVFKDLMAYSPPVGFSSPNVTSTCSFQTLSTFIFFGTRSSILSIPWKLISVSKCFLKKDISLTDAKITGVQNSSIRESSNVFRIISLPIPLISPMEIPTVILSAMLILFGFFNCYFCSTNVTKYYDVYRNY